MVVQRSRNDTRNKQQQNDQHRMTIELQGNRGDDVHYQGKQEEIPDSGFAHERDQAPDSLRTIVEPVAVIEENTDGIDQEESRNDEEIEITFVRCVCGDNRQHRGDECPDTSKEDGFPNRDPSK